VTASTLRLAASASAGENSLPLKWLTLIRVAINLLVVANLGRIPLLSTGDREAPLLLNDIAMLSVIGVAVLAGVTARSFRVDRLTILALMFASVGAYAAMLAIPRYGITPWQLVISLAYLARWLVYFALYVVVINFVRAHDVATCWRTLESTIIAMAAFGLVQAVFIPHFAQVVYPDSRVSIDFDEQGHRLVSTILEPNIAGAMIMLVLLVQLAQLAGGVRISSWKPLVLLVALIATLSRSSMLGLLVGGALILSVRGISQRLLRLASVAVVVAAVAAPWVIRFAASYNKLGIDKSALTRLVSWARAARILSDHPLLGIGFNTYAFVQESYGYLRMGNGTYSLDGGLLFIAVMTGFVGLSIFVAMLALVVKRCRLVWRDQSASPEFRALATGIAAGTLALCVHSLFVNSLLTPFSMEPLFLLWGLGFVIARSRAESVATAPMRSYGIASISPETSVRSTAALRSRVGAAEELR
jgi:Lipid A core - O-antigen ligase and related enzymes